MTAEVPQPIPAYNPVRESQPLPGPNPPSRESQPLPGPNSPSRFREEIPAGRRPLPSTAQPLSHLGIPDSLWAQIYRDAIDQAGGVLIGVIFTLIVVNQVAKKIALPAFVRLKDTIASLQKELTDLNLALETQHKASERVLQEVTTQLEALKSLIRALNQ